MSETLKTLTSHAWRTTAAVGVLAAVALSSGAALAVPDETIIDFESPALEPGNYTSDYSALEAVGVSVVQAFGIVDDLEGDWDLTGNTGSQFLGANDTSNFVIELHFDQPKNYFAIDCARTNGSEDGQGLDVVFFLGDVEVYDVSYSFYGVGEYVSVGIDLTQIPSEYDKVILQASGAEFRPFGCDSLLVRPGFSAPDTELPDTGTAPVLPVLLGALLVGAGLATPKRRIRA